jgi:regulatory protein
MPKRDLSRAKQIAFQLLKFRSRSRQEIIDRLRQKKFPEEIVAQTIDFLARLEYLDDEQFAFSFLQSRLAKPLGLKRIFFELKQKGVDKQIIEQAIERVKQKGYTEIEIVEKMAKDKFRKNKITDKYKAKARVYGFLMRRGFNPEVIKEAVDNL